MNWMHKILMDQKVDNAGGGGSGPVLGVTPPAAGASPSAPITPVDWRTTLPDDLKNDPSLKTINDVPSLAKSFLNAQKLVGADKIVIPSQHATEDDWRGVYHKLGLPEKLEEYKVEVDGKSVDPEFAKGYKELSHKIGILPKQAQALADWFKEQNTVTETKINTKINQDLELGVSKLKEEWGEAFDVKLARAEFVLSEVGDKDLIQFLKDSRLNQDSRVIKLLANIGEKYLTEDKVIDSKTVNGVGKLSPADANKKISSIMSDSKHPYFIKEHPGHKGAMAEMQDLFKMANPAKQTVDKNL